MSALTFEFPTAAAAADFFAIFDGAGSVSHRVVKVETTREHEARALAGDLDGREVRSCGHAACADLCASGCSWTDDNPTCSRCKCTRPEDA